MGADRNRGSKTAWWDEEAMVPLHLDHHTRKDMPVGRDADPAAVKRLIRWATLSDRDALRVERRLVGTRWDVGPRDRVKSRLPN